MLSGESRLKLLQPEVVPKLWKSTVARLDVETRLREVMDSRMHFSMLDFIAMYMQNAAWTAGLVVTV